MNADYEMQRTYEASGDAREAKLTLLANPQLLGHQGRSCQTIYDALLALAEDWDAAAFTWYRDETSVMRQA